MEVRYAATIPPEVLATVRPVIEQNLWILPSWCHTLNVLWDHELNTPAQCQCFQEYRLIRITVGAQMLESGVEDSSLEDLIRHEVLHAYNLPIQRAALDAIRAFFPGDETPGTRIAGQAITQACEGCTEDLVALVKRMRP